MNHNPFTSNIFSTLWSKHFNNQKEGIRFEFFQGLSFFRPTGFSVYINEAKNLSKGISYGFGIEKLSGFGKKVFLIYDVPSYFKLDTVSQYHFIKRYKVKQYPGFLIRLENFQNIQEYVDSTFKGKSKNKLKRDQKRLEQSFEIEYQMYHGSIPKADYDILFDQFRTLLEKRFAEKGEYNNNLDDQEWALYHEVAYPMILDKKACILVVREKNNPICIMLNFLSDTSLYQFMMAFDTDYGKFNVGTTGLLKLIEWCLEQDLAICDFSKGYYPYKKRWGNLSYYFEYHIIYNSRSFQSVMIGLCLKCYFELKQFLRNMKINELLNKYVLRSKSRPTNKPLGYTNLETDRPTSNLNLKKIDLDSEEQQHLKPMVFNFLYYNRESLSDVELLQNTEDSSVYLLRGKNRRQWVRI